MGSKMVFWSTAFPAATAYLTDGGSLAGGWGEENPLPDRQKAFFQRKKSCCPWTLLTVQFEVYIFFSFKEKGAITSYTLRNVIQSFLFILRKSS